MKFTYFQLEAQLAKHVSSVYLVCGEDVILKQDSTNLIRKKAKALGFNERIRLLENDGEQLYTLLYSNSLFMQKRLLELDCRDSYPNKSLCHILHDYGKNPCADILLSISMGKIDSKIAKQAWYQSLEKIGIVVTIWPISREQLPQWIINRSKKYQLQFTADAVHLLADYVEGNLIAASQAIEKIYLLKRGTVVSADLIELFLTNESHFTIFDFIENLIANDKTRSLQILEKLEQSDTEPTLLLWAITRELRLLAEFAQQIKQGLSYEKLFQKHRVFLHRQSALRHFLNRYNEADCWRRIAAAVEIDKTIKGLTPGKTWDALQLFCLQF